jgi:hypothetical protein
LLKLDISWCSADIKLHYLQLAIDRLREVMFLPPDEKMSLVPAIWY